jgi:hypothetical protein
MIKQRLNLRLEGCPKDSRWRCGKMSELLSSGARNKHFLIARFVESSSNFSRLDIS